MGRNLLKLFAERRLGVIGSKFRTRLVVVNLLLSFLPVIALFWFSYGLLNRSIDKWFSQPVEEVRADMAALLEAAQDLVPNHPTLGDVDSVEALLALPMNDLLRMAHETHRAHHDPNAVQLSTLLSSAVRGRRCRRLPVRGRRPRGASAPARANGPRRRCP